MTERALEDLLDLDRHKLSVEHKRKATATERWMKYLGVPVGFAVFLMLYYMPTPAGLTAGGQAIIASFALALIWWIAEPVPTYVTSLVLMTLLIFLDGWDSKNVLGVLGFDVIWLNVLAFILSSVLIKTNLAKRIALSLVVRFGYSVRPMLLSFVLLQLCLAPLIPATAARAVMTLPIMLVVGAIYGATPGQPNNVGRNLFLQNLLGINIFSSGFMTGSTANLIALAFIANMAGTKVYYTDWMFANLPIAMLAMFVAWIIGPTLLFRVRPADAHPQISGGMNALQEQLRKMGGMSPQEKKGALIFGLVVFLWVTDRFHMQWFGFEIDAVMAAMIGAIITLLPKIGILKWNEADIPWHLMIFSAGAYAGGLALNDSGAAAWVVRKIFVAFNFGTDVSFWTVYVIVIALMMYSHFVFTSKTMRTIILIPFIIALAQQLGFNPVALALPAAFTIDWVIGLPISAKPNVILFTTGQYSVLDNLKYGIVIATIGVILLTVAGFTWFRVLGLTPAF
ncbi:MAG: hypothetical protein H6Q31_535 [Bacteroidetes bacterium]|jgi:anion transporter|nr:hypothetical protein [Bacteroidota bacterium]